MGLTCDAFVMHAFGQVSKCQQTFFKTKKKQKQKRTTKFKLFYVVWFVKKFVAPTFKCKSYSLFTILNLKNLKRGKTGNKLSYNLFDLKFMNYLVCHCDF